MQTRDQRYSIDALKRVEAVKEKAEARKDVEAVKEKAEARKYGVMCHKLPILIHTAGLAQALAFVESRKGGIYGNFLRDLGYTIEEKTTLAQAAREAHLNDYMRLTAQIMAALVWYKRFAQSVLGVDVSDVDEEED